MRCRQLILEEPRMFDEMLPHRLRNLASAPGDTLIETRLFMRKMFR